MTIGAADGWVERPDATPEGSVGNRKWQGEVRQASREGKQLSGRRRQRD